MKTGGKQSPVSCQQHHGVSFYQKSDCSHDVVNEGEVTPDFTLIFKMRGLL